MNHLRNTLLFSFCSILLNINFVEACSSLKSHLLLNGIQAQLSRTNGFQPMGFRITDVPILFTTSESPRCVAFYMQNKMDYLSLNSDLRMTQTRFDLRDPINTLSRRNEGLLDEIIQKRGIKKFFIYNIRSGLYDEYSSAKDSVRAHLALIIHEAYHLMKQAQFLGGVRMMGSANLAHYNIRNFINKVCYNENGNRKELLRSEIESLTLALRHRNRNPMTYIQDFINDRSLRYRQMNDIEAYECKLAESKLELIEGTAKYVELKYLFQLGLLNLSDWYNKRWAQSNRAPYYILGAMQIFLLSDLDPGFVAFEKNIERGFALPKSSILTEKLRELK